MRLLLAFFLLLSFNSYCQTSNIDLGFFLETSLRNNRLNKAGNEFDRITSSNNIGFSLGSNGYYLLNESLRFRAEIAIQFENEEITFQNALLEETQKYKSVFFRSGVHGIFRPSPEIPLSIVGGFTPYFLVPDNAEVAPQIYFKTFDLTGDVGLCYTISFETFKCSPEIKYSYNLVNSWESSGKYGNTIDNYFRDRINFALRFHNY